jgi:hypothetical protein
MILVSNIGTYESRLSIAPKRIPDPKSLIISTALSFSSHFRLFRISLFRLTICEYWCLMPRHFTFVHSFSSCLWMLSTFMDCTSAPCRERAVVLPEGSPI